MKNEPIARAGSLWDLIEARAEATPDALSLVDERSRRLTFVEYRTRVERTASALHRRGVRDGMPVSWMLPTALESVVLAGALARLGAVQNPILPIYRDRETRFVLEQTKARVFVVRSRWRNFDYEVMAGRLAGEIGGIEVLSFGDALPEDDPTDLPLFPPAAARDAPPPVRWIYYTSGTTSEPKGAMHTDGSLLAASLGLVRALELGPRDRVALVFPFTHVGGVLWLMASLVSGAAEITIDTFDARATVDVLAKNGVTLAGAGTVFHRAYLEAQRARGPERIFPNVRAFPGGGAPKPPQLHYDVKREMGGAGIVSGYGLTECPIITMGTVRDSDEKLAHTEGRPNPPSAEVRIVREDGAIAKRGEDGEIRVRAPQLMRGYVDPALDRDAFDSDGFFRTGDLGTFDTDGHLRVTGRLKDIIIRKGENISAKEVEDLLHAHPKVREVAVIGIPDPELGERCCAVVAPKDDGDPLRLEEMASFLQAAGLMRQKFPEQLEVVRDLPRNATGKVEKKVLRALFGNE